MSLLSMVGLYYKLKFNFPPHVYLYSPSHYLAKIYTFSPSINVALMLYFLREVYKLNEEDQYNEQYVIRLSLETRKSNDYNLSKTYH